MMSDLNRACEAGINVAGFLVDNIDENGQLQDNILDNDARQQLASLGRLDPSSFLDKKNSHDSNDEEQIENEGINCQFENGNYKDDIDYQDKSATSDDFLEINELAEDITEGNVGMWETEKGAVDYNVDNEEIVNKSGEQLMLPPPKPEGESSIPGEAESARQRRLETPLAPLLPSKYAGIEVTEIFPDFRPNGVLRFSRLFSSDKPGGSSQFWRGVRRRRKKRKHRDTRNAGSDSDQDYRKLKFDGWKMNYGEEPPSELIASDDEVKLLMPMEDEEKGAKAGESGANGDMENAAHWRFGPAQLWYDMLEVPETGEGFNYGFKIGEKKDGQTHGTEEAQDEEEELADDAFLMMSQLHWEDDVIWNGDKMKHKVMQRLNSKKNFAGWVPFSGCKTVEAFSQRGTSVPVASFRQNNTAQGQCHQQQQGEDIYDDTWYSIFPVENEELVYGLWEEEVIWDAENMKKIPKPKILTLDPNDDNIVLGIPDDVDRTLLYKENGPTPKVKVIPQPHVKKSKLLLGKAGLINILEEDGPPPLPQSPHHDPFNISNDIYYMPRFSQSHLRPNLIQHSTPVVELRAPFVQTHMGPLRLRNFHRPPIKQFSHGPLAHPGPHAVLPLSEHIKKKAKQREQERIASGGGDVFFMRTPEDLSGKDSNLILVEFSEEHPPLINQVGMCSKVKNYYKRKAGKDPGPQKYKYGETAYAHTSPFLGVLTPGESIQAIENNMYRAPIYEHNIPETDFLVIRTRQRYFIREINALFVAGQECPLYEVPEPNSKRATNFVRDFLQVFIYRLFWKSRDTPRRIKMDDIKKTFPSQGECYIRKQLNSCAYFKRTGMDSNWWVIKPDFRLPSEEEICRMISPEECCAYFSMLAAEQRLKDAGYGEKFLFAPHDDDDEELQLKMDDEVKVAPWNTTRAYIQAMKGKCLLQLTGPADPTGCGEGFSYISVPNKPTVSKEGPEAQPKQNVGGTDADLRRLPLKAAKAILRKYGLPDEEIKKLSRWEVIDVVRTLSTEKAKAGEEAMTKFSRRNKFSIAAHQERYKEECQRIFQLQNLVLSSAEVLSTDEEESSDEDSSDIEEMGKNIENLLSNKKTSSQLSLEREERQREELRKILMDETQELEGKKQKDKKRGDEEDSRKPGQGFNTQPGRVLKIYRTFRDDDGKEYTRVETVRNAAVIDTYIRIRNSKNETFIKQFATLNDEQTEQMKREKRRLQEQLRRIKRVEERNKSRGGSTSATSVPSTPSMLDRSNINTPTTTSTSILPFNNIPSSSVASKHPIPEIPPTKSRRPKLKADSKLKCGACGSVGHMRTNRACPYYQNSLITGPDYAAMTKKRKTEIDKQCTDNLNLVNVEDTKITLSMKLIKAEELKRQTLLPKEVVSAKKRRRAPEDHCDYLRKHERPAKRRRTDPVVVMGTILESILNEMRDLPDVQPFKFPVSTKAVPDYYKIIQCPMDLQTIRENLRQKKYQSRENFLADVNQIVENSNLYNGLESSLTVAAKRMLDTCVQRLGEKEDRLMKLEKTINPLLDDNDQVALTFILDNVVNSKLKLMAEAWPFLKPVNKKQVEDYYNIIKTPMDLETISKKVCGHKYHNRHEFIRDVEQIRDNCILYNGKESMYTMNAEVLLKISRETLDEYDNHLTQLEHNISLIQHRTMEQAYMDSSWLGPEGENDTIVEPLTQLEHNISLIQHRAMEQAYMDSSWLGPEGENDTIVEPLTQLEHNISLIQHRAMEQAYMDSSWLGPEGENDTNVEPEYSSSQMNIADNQFGKSSIDDFNFADVHPKKKDVLEEDLQFSSEDEFIEVPWTADEQRESGDLGELDLGEMRNCWAVAGDDDSQQAVEAMVQLGNVGLFGGEQQKGNMDVDPNCDVSDFLLAGLVPRAKKIITDKVHDDLMVSESDEEHDNTPGQSKPEIQSLSQLDEEVNGYLCF
ncbi:transcription initiation factor TFIID subunit 1 isoform X2 [Diachasma alloeum]|uniref:transcription initiation factor TFIID subunit 1 isoform X2 n=1 Tax=Diachasma alloeum TaxID=454923 RepID=UPI0007381415|nr:transcription initiation factor TFIID subunit 1 isoform X2 [Diachasma alloeum]